MDVKVRRVPQVRLVVDRVVLHAASCGRSERVGHVLDPVGLMRGCVKRFDVERIVDVLQRRVWIINVKAVAAVDRLEGSRSVSAAAALRRVLCDRVAASFLI
jgi:hypothetical protein